MVIIYKLIFWASILIPSALLLFFGSKKLASYIRHTTYSLWRKLIAAIVTRTLDYKNQTAEITRLNSRLETLQNQINLMLDNPKLYSKNKSSGQISLPLGEIKNGQRLTVKMNNPQNNAIEVWSLPYTEFNNWNAGKVKVTRHTEHHNGRKWVVQSNKVLWLSETEVSETYSYTDNDYTRHYDTIEDLNWRYEYSEQESTAQDTTPAIGQLSLFGN